MFELFKSYKNELFFIADAATTVCTAACSRPHIQYFYGKYIFYYDNRVL